MREYTNVYAFKTRGTSQLYIFFNLMLYFIKNKTNTFLFEINQGSGKAFTFVTELATRWRGEIYSQSSWCSRVRCIYYNHTAVAVSWKVGPVNQVKHTSWVTIIAQTYRPKSLCNRTFCSILCCCIAFHDFSISKGSSRASSISHIIPRRQSKILQFQRSKFV